MAESLQLRPFQVLTDVNGACVIYSVAGTAFVTNSSLAHALHDLVPLGGSVVATDDLVNTATNNGTAAEKLKSLLIDCGVAAPAASPGERIRNILVYSDDDALYQTLNQDHQIASNCRITPLRTPDSVDQVDFANGETLAISFQRIYDGSEIGSLYGAFRGTASFFLTAFIVQDFLHIDPLYIPSLATPSHFSNRERLRKRTVLKSRQSPSWLDLFDAYVEGLLMDPPAQELDYIDRLACVTRLAQYVKGLTTPGYANPTSTVHQRVVEYHFPTGIEYCDVVPHGEHDRSFNAGQADKLEREFRHAP